MQDVDLNKEKAQIVWIGYGSQEILDKSKITALQTVDEDLLYETAVCLSVYPATGMWYEC